MALFKGVDRIESTSDQYMRTNTKLKHSDHDAPSEKFLVDPRLKGLFKYHFGGDGWVVIPKGRIVAPSRDNGSNFKNGTMLDYDADVYRPVITLANGGKDVEEIGKSGKEHTRKANIPIGVASANIYEEIVADFHGMQPTIENEIYIELPYIPNKSEAEETEWGALYDVDPTNGIKNGDFVMSDENGRFVKADIEGVKEKIAAADDLSEMKEAMAELARLQEQIIGQVWSVETNLPPQGWLKWVGWSDEQRQGDSDFRRDGIDPGLSNPGEFPGYPYEKTYANYDHQSQKYYPQGVPGLTDGSNIEVPFEDKEIGQINPKQSGRHDFRILETPIVEGSLKVKVDGEEVEPAHVDYKTGIVVLMIDEPKETPRVVTASFKATSQIPGVPTGWDFKGSVGAVRILLQK